MNKIIRLDGYVKTPKEVRQQFPNIRELLRMVPMAAPLPATYSTVPLSKITILNQGSTPECVSFASCGMKTDEVYRATGTTMLFDPSWLYNQIAQPGGGAYPSDAIRIMSTIGMKPQKCKGKASMQYGIAGGYVIDASNTDDEIKQVLMLDGTMLDASIWYDNWMGIFRVFPNPGNANGGHCYRHVGWDDNYGGWIIPNSWGKGMWGNYYQLLSGIAIIPYSIYRNVILPQDDCWKIIPPGMANGRNN
jgi:C1A family cysteine protease